MGVVDTAAPAPRAPPAIHKGYAPPNLAHPNAPESNAGPMDVVEVAVHVPPSWAVTASVSVSADRDACPIVPAKSAVPTVVGASVENALQALCATTLANAQSIPPHAVT